jgi:hypothetical protein
MISNNGKNFGFQKDQQLTVKNLKWFVTCTVPTINIIYQIPVPVIQK